MSSLLIFLSLLPLYQTCLWANALLSVLLWLIWTFVYSLREPRRCKCKTLPLADKSFKSPPGRVKRLEKDEILHGRVEMATADFPLWPFSTSVMPFFNSAVPFFHISLRHFKVCIVDFLTRPVRARVGLILKPHGRHRCPYLLRKVSLTLGRQDQKVRMISCIRIRTRGGIYSKIWPES